MKVTNFKKFGERIFEFNPDLNILVGDNESGKSTILEAIEMSLNFSYRGKPLTSSLSPDLFNAQSIQTYLNGDKGHETLPELRIEVFLDGIPEYRGDNNTLNEDTEGISLVVSFDDELLPAYQEFAAAGDAIKTIPTELYKVEWFDFGWNTIRYQNRRSSCLFVDPSNLHPTFGKNRYISQVMKSRLSPEQRATLNLNLRQLRELFNEQPQVREINNELDADNEITSKNLQIMADVSPSSSMETNMQLAVDSIGFSQIGKGEQNAIQLKLAIQNRGEQLDVIMVEEPENHLSHINLVKLIKYIDDRRGGKQLFLTTHSSYVLNKLSIDKLCLIGDNYVRLNDLDPKVVKRLKRLPGYDTLRVALSGKVILVEGPSDELVLKKIYLNQYNKLPEEDGVDIIVVRGLGFENYLQIARNIGTRVHVVKDNDGSFCKNIWSYAQEYVGTKTILFFSDSEDMNYSLEPAMIAANSADISEIDIFAQVILSTQTYNKYQDVENLQEPNFSYIKYRHNPALNKKVYFLKEWFQGENTGSKKVDSAMRLFESEAQVKYPTFLSGALRFDE